MIKGVSEQEPFTKVIKDWLHHGKDKTLKGLIDIAGEKAFAMIFLVLMATPALPIPTGGIVHIFEVITVLGSVQLIFGRRTIWLPKKWLKINMGKIMKGKAASKFISVIGWFEKWSRHRWSGLLKQRLFLSLTGIFVTVFSITAFVAPPFSGLDTLPALGVVIISLALILEDTLMYSLGVIVGFIGIGLTIAAGTAIYSGLTNIF